LVLLAVPGPVPISSWPCSRLGVNFARYTNGSLALQVFADFAAGNRATPLR
jgi:hypothetical protein